MGDDFSGELASTPTSGRLDLLTARLLEAREAGFLGPGPVDRHIDHSRSLAGTVSRALGTVPERVADLGSGAGIPGMVLACLWPESHFVLVEAGARRARGLVETIRACGLERQVEVVHARAEEAGRDPRYRGRFPAVVARSFGRPSVTAECAAPLLASEGVLVVSEPPATDSTEDRWPAGSLHDLGLRLEAVAEGEFRYAVLRRVSACPDRYPRRVGVPTKRPLF